MTFKRKKLLPIIIISLILIIVPSLFLAKSLAKSLAKQTVIPKKMSDNKKIITDLVNDSDLYGTLAVVRDGKVLYTEGFGYADETKKIKNDDSVLYPIASLQKKMTAVIIAQLIKEKKLDYTTTIDTFYPDLEASDDITIRDLLNHTSGYIMPETPPKKVLKTEKEQLDNVFETSVYTGNHNPAYSNGNYSLLAGIISQLDGTTYEESITKRIFEPLHMENSYLWNQVPSDRKVPTEYFYANGSDYNQDNLIYSEELMSSLLGAGNVYASASDVATFELSLDNNTLLTNEEYFALFSIESDTVTGSSGNISADGIMGGYSSYTYGNTSNQNMIIFLANQSTSDSPDVLLETIYEQSLLF